MVGWTGGIPVFFGKYPGFGFSDVNCIPIYGSYAGGHYNPPDSTAFYRWRKNILYTLNGRDNQLFPGIPDPSNFKWGGRVYDDRTTFYSFIKRPLLSCPLQNLKFSPGFSSFIRNKWPYFRLFEVSRYEVYSASAASLLSEAKYLHLLSPISRYILDLPSCCFYFQMGKIIIKSGWCAKFNRKPFSAEWSVSTMRINCALKCPEKTIWLRHLCYHETLLIVAWTAFFPIFSSQISEMLQIVK